MQSFIQIYLNLTQLFLSRFPSFSSNKIKLLDSWFLGKGKQDRIQQSGFSSTSAINEFCEITQIIPTCWDLSLWNMENIYLTYVRLLKRFNENVHKALSTGALVYMGNKFLLFFYLLNTIYLESRAISQMHCWVSGSDTYYQPSSLFLQVEWLHLFHKILFSE